MWWAGSKPLDVYLGQRAVALCDGAGVVFFERVACFAEATRCAHDRLQGRQGRRALRVWLSGGLCRPFLVPTVSGIKGDREMQLLASTVAAARTGLDGDCRVWVERQHPHGGHMAVAVQRDTLAGIDAALNGLARVRSIRPWWAEALRAAMAGQAGLRGFGLHDCDSLTLLSGAGNSFGAVSTFTPITDHAAAAACWARASLSTELEPEHCLFWSMVNAAASRPQACALGPLLEAGP